jgi:hypothetical protein
MREILPAVAAAMTPILLLGLIVAGVGSQAVAWRPPLIWSSPTVAEPTAVTTDNMSLYITGKLFSPTVARANAPSGSVFLARYSLGGLEEWTRVFGNITDDTISGVSAGSDGVYIAGYIDGNVTTRKYDLNGIEVWSRQYARPIFSADGIYVTANGAYVTGTTVVSCTYCSQTGAYVQKLDFNGNIVWTNQFSNATSHTNTDPSVKGLYADSSSVYVVGGIYGNLPGQTSSGLSDAYVLKLSNNGDELWAHQFGTQKDDEADSVLEDATGVYVAGEMGGGPASSFSGFLRKYDSNGNVLWNNQLPAPDGSNVIGATISAGGSGSYLSMSTNANNFLMKYNSNGSQVWIFRSEFAAASIAAGTSGVYVVGQNLAGGNVVASVGEFGSSSSLVFFGLNPPLSFAVLGAVLGASALSIVLFAKYRKKRTALKATRRPKPSGQPDESPLPRWKPA